MGMMTHLERLDRRRKMAQRISDGDSVCIVCQEFSVSATTIRASCVEFGVRVLSSRSMKVSTLYIVAQLQNTNLSGSQIARDCNVSRQLVHQIFERAKEAGIVFSTFRKGVEE